MKKYRNIVSLGHFCSPAMEFERIKRRQFSLPFDWLITPNLSDIITLINNDFEDFLTEKYLFQLIEYPQYYRNIRYNIDFYHDFYPFESFKSQINDIRIKYNRRINRFFDTIKQPTLFVRYITENDIKYISEHYEFILKTIKRYNTLNSIIFVSNDSIRMDLLDVPVYYVEKDANDSVSRHFLDANNELLQYILNNVESITTQKQTNNNRSLTLKKIRRFVRKKLKLVYRHSRQCHVTSS